MSDVTYQPKYEPGDEILLDGQYTTILGLEDGEYILPRKGKFKQIEASEIDAVAEDPPQQHG